MRQAGIGTRAALAFGTLAAALLVTVPSAAQQHKHAATPPAARSGIPAAIVADHAEIQQQLESATQLTGMVGAAARELAALLKPHFEREERLALPPLALLKPLAQGDFEPAMTRMLPITDALVSELPNFLAEHQAIARAARTLQDLACANGNTEVEAFAVQLLTHASLEEDVLYPAAMLVAPVLRIESRSHGIPN